MITSPLKNIVIQYLIWHFYEMSVNILKGWRNFLVFNLNYFSIPLLLKTLFSHWRRYRYSYGRGFDFKRYAEVFSFNMISRVIGAIMRSFLIIIGLLVEIFILLCGAIIFLGWLVLPILLLLGLFFGLKLIF